MVAEDRMKISSFTIKNNILKGKVVPCSSAYVSVGQILWDCLQEYADFPAQIDTQTNVEEAFADIRDRAIKCALWLQKQGVGKGDIIAVSTHNHLDSFVPCIAALFLGAAFNPWDHTMNIQLARHYMSTTQPRVIFANEQSVGTVLEAAKIEVFSTKVVAFGHYFGVTPFSEILTGHNKLSIANFECTEIKDPERMALILFSSGTTGVPKGVQISHQVLINYLEATDNVDFTNQVPLWFSTLSWITGVLFNLKNIAHCSKKIIPPAFEEKVACEIIEKYKVTWMLLGTSMTSRFARYNRLSEYDLSSLKVLVAGGSSMKKEAQDYMRKRLPHVLLLQGYGMSELGSVIAIQFPTTSSGSCGVIAPNCEVKIIDTETGKPLGPNQNGELCAKSWYMMTCYYNNPEATRNIIDEDGWLHSGDLAYYNEKGELYIVDRLKDLIKYRGNAVSPAEIEQRLQAHPSVFEVAVVGMPHLTDGEHPIAFVSKVPNREVTEKELIDIVAINFRDHYKLRGGVKFLPTLPHTPSGKISKKDLKAIAKALSVF